MRRSSIRDVAKEAGVSTATVSHVINGTRYVADETMQRVQQAMKNLGYTPNYAAKTLRSQKTSTVGLILPDISNHFFTSVAGEIENVLDEHGYQLLVGNTNESIDKELKKLQAFTSQQIEGLILATSATDYNEIASYIPEDLPVVFIDRLPNKVTGSSILADNANGAKRAVEQLVRSGHREIGMITGLEELSTTQERIAGYMDALEANQITYDPSLVYKGDSQFAGGFEGCQKLLESSPEITALFVANNLMSIGAMTYLASKNYNIPTDIAIIGFDDYEWAKITSPPLTVVKQPVKEIGHRAAEILIQKMTSKEKSDVQHVIQTELVLRETH